VVVGRDVFDYEWPAELFGLPETSRYLKDKHLLSGRPISEFDQRRVETLQARV
jgi:hypothetical protein